MAQDTQTPSESPSTAKPERPKSSLLRTFGIVLASFIMIGRNRHFDEDAPRITPVQLVIVGIVGGILFVGSILTLVTFIVRNAQ